MQLKGMPVFTCWKIQMYPRQLILYMLILQKVIVLLRREIKMRQQIKIINYVEKIQNLNLYVYDIYMYIPCILNMFAYIKS